MNQLLPRIKSAIFAHWLTQSGRYREPDLTDHGLGTGGHERRIKIRGSLLCAQSRHWPRGAAG